MKIADALRILGWYWIANREVEWSGELRQYKHPRKRGRLTIAGKVGAHDLAPGALESILKQSGYFSGYYK